MSLKKVVACIKRNKKFLITTHKKLEGDALGSELAFYKLLRTLGKRVTVLNEDDVPSGYRFLPGVDKIKKFKNKLKNIEFDCFVALDCSDLKRCGEVSKLNLDNKLVVNIDHHISNDKFGHINWLDPDSSSCAQMIYNLFKKLHLKLNKEVAMLLYVGILTDTGSFHYPNTNRLTHSIVSDLLRYNLDIPKIYKNIYEDIPFQDVKLLMKILPTIKRGFCGRVVWFEISRKMLKNRRVSFDLNEQLLNFARTIKDSEIAMLFRESLEAEKEVYVNLRSRGKIDVNKIASFFGGGGHKAASGCTVKGKIDNVKRRVLSKIAEAIKE